MRERRTDRIQRQQQQQNKHDSLVMTCSIDDDSILLLLLLPLPWLSLISLKHLLTTGIM